MRKTALYKWYSKFEQGDNPVTDEPRPDRPSSISTKKIETVKELLDSDRWMTIRDITVRTGYTLCTVFRTIHNKQGMRRICARWISHMIDENQMCRRVELSQQFIERELNYSMDFLNRIVTVDETWISTYDPETKQESSMWKTPGSPSPKKFKVSRSATKRMFIVFFDVKGVILSHAVTERRTVNAAYYSKV